MVSKQKQIADTEAKMAASLAAMKQTKLNGFAARIDALGSLAKKSSTIFWTSIFITLLFIVIETTPLFVKIISERSPYDYRLNQHETLATQVHNSYVGKLVSANEAELDFIKETNSYQTKQTIVAEKELIKKVIESEIGNITEEVLTWQDYKTIGRRFT